MRYLLIVLLGIPFLSNGQLTQKKMEDEITQFILRYRVHEDSSYFPVRFSGLDTIRVMSKESIELKDSLIKNQYLLFEYFSNDSISISKEEYNLKFQKYQTKIKEIDQQKKIIEGYSLKHTFKARDRYDSFNMYEGKFIFDINGKLIESNIKEIPDHFEKGS